jgi:hypothetical protein
MENVKIVKYKAFNEIASSVVHEMKNPLSAITLGLEYIQLGSAEAKAKADVFSNISTAVGRLNEMLENLRLIFSDESESGKRTPLKISEILGKTKGLMNYYLTKNHIHFEINADGDEPWIIGNEGQLMTIFFLAAAWLIRRAESGSSMVFQLAPENGSIKVMAVSQGGSGSLSAKPRPAGDKQTTEALKELASANGWQATFAEPDDGKAELTISFPAGKLMHQKEGLKWAGF